MKVYIVLIISLLISVAYNLKYEQLSLNKPYTLNSGDKPLQFYQISLKDEKNIPNEISIATQIIDSKYPLTSTIGVYYEPFKKTNFKQIKREILGKTVVLDSDFIQSAIKEEQDIYLAIYCEKCSYKINMVPSGELVITKKFIQNTPLRGLIEQRNLGLEDDGRNTTETRMNIYAANGISGLIVAFFMIFVSVIACIIMMNIYVHNTALVEQPLKLGRVEA